MYIFIYVDLGRLGEIGKIHPNCPHCPAMSGSEKVGNLGSTARELEFPLFSRMSHGPSEAHIELRFRSRPAPLKVAQESTEHMGCIVLTLVRFIWFHMFQCENMWKPSTRKSSKGSSSPHEHVPPSKHLSSASGSSSSTSRSRVPECPSDPRKTWPRRASNKHL